MKLCFTNDLSQERVKNQLAKLRADFYDLAWVRGSETTAKTWTPFETWRLVWNNTVESACLEKVGYFFFDIPSIDDFDSASHNARAAAVYEERYVEESVFRNNYLVSVICRIDETLDAVEKASVLNTGPTRPNKNSPIGFRVK